MRIPNIQGLGVFGVRNFNVSKGVISDISKRFNSPEPKIDPPLTKDTVSFGSVAQGLKKYDTLPDEIKRILSPRDAVEMFEDIDRIALGIEKGDKIGQGENSAVYENPWLEGYYLLILKNPSCDNQKVYSEVPLGDSIWQDVSDNRIQLIRGQ